MGAGKRSALRAGVLGMTLTVWASLAPGLAAADTAWVQIEALPTLDQAQTRLRDLATSFPDAAGFTLPGGWYGLALGPYDTPEIAAEALRQMRNAGLIPADSYVADGSRFRAQFWPAATTGAAPASEPTPAPDAEPAPEPAPPPVETLADARRAEEAMGREGRMRVQEALEWVGVYSGGVDGAFGRGTRASIAAWQDSHGFEPTGVLKSAELRQLLDGVAAEKSALGLTPVEETKAGIGIDLPLGLVEFDHYDPPFVHYRAKDASGVRVLLISEPGDQNTLYGLYDAMASLEIVPTTGPRSRDKSGFSLVGEDAQIHSVTEVRLSKGLIKGFTLVYPAADAPRMARVLAAMKTSFTALGETALDPTLGQPMAVGRADLIAGLDVRHPEFARSGLFIDAKGAVLTASEGLSACGKVTIEGAPAKIAFADPHLGIAVLQPLAPLAPPAVARFETVTAGRGAALAVAGFSYPEALSAPVVSFGTLSDLTGLAGEPERARLAVKTLPGDVGGPVLDGAGAVLGVVLPRGGETARLLPPEMTVAVQTSALVPVLAARGFAPLPAEAGGTLAAEDISALAQGFTVQIACWK
ncbi:peptidoglycan-binding protein [Rhodobacter capsulatus]|uniref:Sporulation related domain-containing protein n=1 Tax=Rhodobacter capsulatus TaxID=1061 RepID=A0A1G7N3T3_RHOCA|nr:trypsin-like peptidase domain-containing protein [Rhodobacter capsulatus]WER08258.1 peptidoglycan-binding protein [Rhodobacter capsulatus]SDF68664.1 Sporulation related domain-containing protein [Rhodobacter capsulatus]